jgi:hypothetical protein
MIPTARYGLVALLSLLTTSTAVSITPKGQTVEVNGNTYYVPTTVVTTLKIQDNQSGQNSDSDAGTLVPLTVVQSDLSKLTTSALESIVNGYEKADDVFNTGFLESMFCHQKYHIVNGRQLMIVQYRYIYLLQRQQGRCPGCLASIQLGHQVPGIFRAIQAQQATNVILQNHSTGTILLQSLNWPSLPGIPVVL